LLTDAERGRLSAFPSEVPTEDLYAFFTLTGPDRAAVPARSAPANRLGFALSLCAVRYLGFCPEDLASVPRNVAFYVGQQLLVPPDALASYPGREQTRTDHLTRVYEHLGYRRPSPDDLRGLFGWLVQRALEHDDAPLLVSLLAQRLKRERFVRPGVSRLERMVAAARERAGEETFRALSPLLPEERRTALDALLVPDAGVPGPPGRTRHSWLKEGATSNTPRAILGQLEKIAYLRGLGADRLDLSALNPNRLKFLASLGRRHTNQALRRLAPERRYPVMLAFLAESHAEITDEAIDLFDRLLAQADARSRRDLEEFRRGATRAIGEKVRLFREVGEIVLDPRVPDAELRQAVLGLVGSAERLEELVEESGRLARPLDDNYFGFFVGHYAHLRRFAPAFLGAFSFRSGSQGETLLRAVESLKELDASGKRRVPADAPRSFVPARWEPYVLAGPGRIDRRHWEACLLWELRGALRSGDVWVEGSRRYADPQKYLIPKDRWPALKDEVGLQTGTSPEGAEQLAERKRELGRVLGRLRETVSRGGSIQVQEGKLVFSRDRSDGPPESAVALQKEIGERLPKVELTDLLVEGDRLAGFSRFFTHASGAVPRTPDLRVHLYASVLAQATNLGPVRMAELSDLSYRKLAWATNWYLREETLKDAVAAVVNLHHKLPLSAAWGGGTLSSSDGQRFPVDVKARNAAALPRYFGYGKGVTFYSWTSEQFSQYGTKVVPSTVRDATYVLDGILGNETELPIAEHAVDTHGFTEVVFALFAALGLRFSPRIRDVADQRLWRIDGAEDAGFFDGLLKGRIDEKLILRHWDDILRVAGSLKTGWVTSSLLVSRLQARPRKNALTRALQEYGRLEKTIFLLRYAESEDLRRRIGRQLNKGEELHALRRFLFFANEGHVRKRQPEEQTEQALCLNLLTDAVILWNTVRYGEILEELRSEGFPVNDEDVAHLSPTRYGHVNPYGRYRFDLGPRSGGARSDMPGDDPQPRLPGTV
jgi:TnpA family transposase